MEASKYIHKEKEHNVDAPMEIVPVLVELLKPRSVVDVGCGIGTFLYCFKKQGVEQVLGIDGAWVDKTLREKYLADNEFMITDLEKPFNLSQKFDLAMSLEVAEHLSETSANAFVKNLTALGDVVVFSAAIPYQGGQNHLNEQWPSYWESIFNSYGYEFHDVIRPLIWNNDKIFWWYRQNIFLVTKKGVKIDPSSVEKFQAGKAKSMIHPEVFTYNAKVAEAATKKLALLEEGKHSIKVYIQLLFRAMMRKLGLLGKTLPTIIFNPEDPLQK